MHNAKILIGHLEKWSEWLLLFCTLHTTTVCVPLVQRSGSLLDPTVPGCYEFVIVMVPGSDVMSV